jgi:hypothetical protein
MDRGNLDPTEPHPAAQNALDYIKTIKYTDLMMWQESFASCAIEGNRLAEICSETMHRLLTGQTISDRYLLGLSWTIRSSLEGLSESWRPVYGYEREYSVSTLGRVRRNVPCANAKKGQILALIPDSFGYLKVHLYKAGAGKVHFIHRIVARAFLGELPRGLQVNHKDGDKENNTPSNLEYVTCSENMKHAHKIGLTNQVGSKNNASKLNEKDAQKIKERLAEGECHKDIAKEFGVSRQTVGLIKNGITWKK